MEHPPSSEPKHAPPRWIPKIYGQKLHLAPTEDVSKILGTQGTKHIQRVVGSFLYYARAIENSIHPALNDITAAQSAPTGKTKDSTIMLMDYLYTYLDAKSRYHTSNINCILTQMRRI